MEERDDKACYGTDERKVIMAKRIDKICEFLYPFLLGFMFSGLVSTATPSFYPYVFFVMFFSYPALIMIHVHLHESEINRKLRERLDL